MSISQDFVGDPRVRSNEHHDLARGPSPFTDNPWRSAAQLLATKIRGNLAAILLAALVCAAFAGGSKFLLPAKYKATTQILIDPQIESRYPQTTGESQSSTLEANAGINYVESQMGVITSERVLLRVIRDQGLGATPAADQPAQEDATARRARELIENRALLKLQKALTVARAERSFLVSVAVTDPDPENAAAVANAIVKAYGEVNATDRAALARRIAMDLGNRVDDLRKVLSEAQGKLQAYKNENNLVGLNDRLIVERTVADATDSLATAEKAEVQGRARLKQLESAPNDIAAVAAFGADPESRQLQVLIVGRAATAAEVEQLASTLGDHHPALIAARTRLRDYNQRMNLSLEGLRRTVRSQIAEARTQVAAARTRLTLAADEMAKLKQVDPSLRQLEDTVEAKRRALTELELKQRLSEGGRVESGGFRVVSPARAPNLDGKVFAAALWSVFGGLIGLALAIASLAVRTIFEADATSPSVGSDVGVKAQEALEDSLQIEKAEVKSLDETPLIGSLPTITPRPGLRWLNVAEAQTEVWRRPTSPFSLEVARIYENLSCSHENAYPEAVLIAGASPQCGASTLAANLARVAAAQGRRVLLIDAHKEHPTLGLTIGADAPKTLIKLAKRWRPLFRLEPYGQSLNLIPSLDNEDRLCRDIADENEYQRIDGINGNFDFVVLDGPDATKASDLRMLMPAASKVVFVAPRGGCDAARLARLLRDLSVPPEKFAGCVSSTLVEADEAA